MSMTLVDGPAKGNYFVKRAPLFLRAVVDEDGGADVLDQLNDEPRQREKVYVYQRKGEVGGVHLHFGGKMRRQSGFYVLAEYAWLADVNGDQLRETESWQAWAYEQACGTEAAENERQ